MALNYVRPPIDYYPDFNTGRPIFNGDIYVGEPDTDPEIGANQKQITIRQEDGTEIPVSQPMKTSSGGVPIYNGSPVQILVDGNYSIKVLNKSLAQVYYQENAFDGEPVTTTTGDTRYAAIFGSVADMLALTPLVGVDYVPVSGDLVRTTSYYTSIPYTEPQGGGGAYRVMSLAEYGLTPDEVGAAFTVGAFAFVRIFSSVARSSDFGVVGDGSTDDSIAMQAADNFAANNVLEIVGTVLYTSSNLTNTANYIFAEGSSIVDARGQQIVMLDSDNKTVVGLQHNHLLEDETTLGSNAAQTSGNINTPPPAVANRVSDVDVLAYWYQDFGLDYTRVGNGANGDLTWYYWDWNFATNSGDGVTTPAYNADRRPWLGYYRGDDANVLGWQCYWLAKYGVTGTILQQREGTGFTGYGNITSRWSSPTDVNHWLYQLFNNTPNFSAIQYQLWGFSSFLPNTAGNQTICRDSWTEVINNIYLKYRNFHYIEKNGEIFPCLFMFEGKGPSTTFGTAKDTKDFYIEMAGLFKAAGYAGMAIMARSPEAAFIGDSYLESNGVIYMSAEYSNIESSGTIGDYKDYFVDNLDFDASDRIRGVANTMTSRHYVYPHPSTGFTTTGYTPDLFRQAVSASVEQIRSTDSPNILTIYNVSEWAEGGPALQPNCADGFSWLESLANGLRDGNGTRAKSMRLSSDTLLWKNALAGSERVQNLDPNSAKILTVQTDFSPDEPIAADRLPNILPGFDGQVCRLMVGGSHTFRLVDDAVAAGTGLKLSHLGGAGAKLALTPNQFAEFVYDSALGLWVCISTTGTPT